MEISPLNIAKQAIIRIDDENNLKGLIIDLRNNGGGIVQEALQIADYITDKGDKLLITVDKDNKEEITKAVDNNSCIFSHPIFNF